jgi:hypothetical protein
MVTASNRRGFFNCTDQVISSQTPLQFFYNRLTSKFVLVITSGHVLSTKHRSLYSFISMRICLFAKASPSNGCVYLLTYLLTYLLMELSPSWEAANCAAIQELPSNFKEPEGSSPCSQELSLPWARLIQSIPSHPISISGCVYLLIQNLFPSSKCCFIVLRSLLSNGSTRYSIMWHIQ